MTTTTIRQILLNYLAEAEDDKVNAIYTLLKSEIGVGDNFVLTEEQYQILDDERALHLAGKSKSYTREEARQLIKG